MKTFEDFEKEASQYQDIITRYKKTGEIFTDPNFHPTANIEEFKYKFTRSHVWKRIDEYFKAPMFKPSLINSNFIKQGDLGDCYFLSALSRIANQPELVKKLFDDTANLMLGEKDKNVLNIKCGAVVIYFHAFGRETPVLIDTLIPFKRGSRIPRFSCPKDLNVSPWFCLVEKAFAKLNGSYASVDGGTFPGAIYSLFGYYPDVKWVSQLKEPKKVIKMSPFDRLMKYQRNGDVMAAAIHTNYLPKGISSDDLEDLGLVAGHSYVLMKARQEGGKNFVCLRNPWGGHEWLGDWSDTSELWTDELKEGLGMNESEDGSFWMIEKDFFYYYVKIDIAKPIPSEFHTRRFVMHLTPGPHDGAMISSPQADIGNRTNYAIQITEPIPKGEKCKVYFIIERRHQAIDMKTMQYLNPTNLSVILLRTNSEKITPEVYRHTGEGRLVQSQSDLTGFSYVIRQNRYIFTFFAQRTQKRDYPEDCYIQVICKYDFKLYDIDKPDELIPESNTEGYVFDNYSVRHPLIAPQMFPKSYTVNDTEEHEEEEEQLKVSKEEYEKAKAMAEEEAKAKEKAEEDAKAAMEEVAKLQEQMKQMKEMIADHERKLQEEKEKHQSEADMEKQNELEKQLEAEKSLLATNRIAVKNKKRNARNLKQKVQRKNDEMNQADELASFLFQSIKPKVAPQVPNKKPPVKQIDTVVLPDEEIFRPSLVPEGHNEAGLGGLLKPPMQIANPLVIPPMARPAPAKKDVLLNPDNGKTADKKTEEKPKKDVVISSTSSDSDDEKKEDKKTEEKPKTDIIISSTSSDSDDEKKEEKKRDEKLKESVTISSTSSDSDEKDKEPKKTSSSSSIDEKPALATKKISPAKKRARNAKTYTPKIHPV